MADDRPQARGDLSLRGFLVAWWSEMLGVDGRFWRTLRIHLLRPGSHAAGHLRGQTEHLISPIRFYLLVNLAFFLVLPLFNSDSFSVWSFTLDSLSELPPQNTEAVARAVDRWPAGEAAYRAAFDERVASNQAVYLAAVIPMVGVPLWLLLRRRRRFLVEHLMLATDLLTFALLSLFVFGLAALCARLIAEAVGRGGNAFAIQMALLQLWMLGLLIGFEGAARRFYGLRWWWSATLSVLLSVVFMAAGWIFGKLLFWLTLLTL